MSFVDKGRPSGDRLSDKKQGSIPTNRVTDQSGSNGSSSSSRLSSPPMQLTENLVVESGDNEQEQCGEVNVILELIKSRFPSLRSTQAPFSSSYMRDNSEYNLETLEEDMCIRIRKEMCDTSLSSSLKKDDGSSASGGSPVSSRDADCHRPGKYIASLSSKTSENSLGFENRNGDRELTESVSMPFVCDGLGMLDCDGIHLSSCGHAVHQDCLDSYLSSLKER